MPAEWAKHDSTWLSWPKNPLTFPLEIVAKVEAAYVAMIEALAAGERVDLLVEEVGEFADATTGRDIIGIADIEDHDPAEVADTYFALMDRLGTDGLLTAVSALPRSDRWHSLARLAIRDDIYASLRSLCFDVLAVGEPDESGEEKIAEWEHTSASRVERARRTLTEIYESGQTDLATLSVAARQIRRMTSTSGRGSSG